MLASFATLAFLATLWLANLVFADVINRRLDKIIAALGGRSMLASAPSVRLVAARFSQCARPARVLYAQSQLRAAA